MLTLSLGGNAELRALEPWNAAELAEFTAKHREFLAPWLPWAEIVVDEASARGFLQRYADRTATDSGRIYGIWDDDVLVGGTLWRVWENSIKLCELGVWLSPGATGKGLITGAARHMIDWAVRKRGMMRVEWICDTTNAASKATAARLGMTYEGPMRSLYVVQGRRVDAERWAILAEEWKSRDTEVAAVTKN